MRATSAIPFPESISRIAANFSSREYSCRGTSTVLLQIGRLHSLGTELIQASHLRHTFSGVDLAHRSQLQFTGILLSGHQHCSPPFNVAGPLIACLTFGVHSKMLPPPFFQPGPPAGVA